MRAFNKESVLSIFIVIFSGFVVSFYLTGGVREQFYNRPWVGLLIVAIPYFIIYLGLKFLGKVNQIPSFAQLLGISISGSLILSVYIFGHTVIDLNLTSTQILASRFYIPTLSVFLMASLIFFLISAVFSIVAKFMILKLSE